MERKVDENNLEHRNKNPQRTYVDVVRKGGKRRGYITVRKQDDGRVEVGWSLCELKDRFRGDIGLEIAFKRGKRVWGKSYTYTRHGGDVLVGEGSSSIFVIPRSFVGRLLGDVEHMVEKSTGSEVVLPQWVIKLQTQYAANEHVTMANEHVTNIQPLGGKESAEYA